MPSSRRERELIDTFVELADTLVADFDILELLHLLVIRCADILDASGAGILLRTADGMLQVVAATSERSHLIGLLQLDAREGPCVEAVATGSEVAVSDIAGIYARWPSLAVEAGRIGYQSIHAVPLRLRDEVIGSLNLYSDRQGPLGKDDAAAARGLADIATIGILHERAWRRSEVIREQLQGALDSRVVVEQAKGVIAQSRRIDMDEAFKILRQQARGSGRLLSDVAREVVTNAAGDEGPQ